MGFSRLIYRQSRSKERLVRCLSVFLEKLKLQKVKVYVVQFEEKESQGIEYKNEEFVFNLVVYGEMLKVLIKIVINSMWMF